MFGIHRELKKLRKENIELRKNIDILKMEYYNLLDEHNKMIDRMHKEKLEYEKNVKILKNRITWCINRQNGVI